MANFFFSSFILNYDVQNTSGFSSIIKDGTVNIAKNESDVYTVSFDLVDESNESVTGQYTGYLIYYNNDIDKKSSQNRKLFFLDVLFLRMFFMNLT